MWDEVQRRYTVDEESTETAPIEDDEKMRV
jgi:hypothetical protein